MSIIPPGASLPFDRNQLREAILCAPPTPTLTQKICEVNRTRNEMLLAVMAAGVPAGCIELIGTEDVILRGRFDWSAPLTISAGFRFTTTEVYWAHG